MPKAHIVYTGIYGFFFEGLGGDHADTVWALAPDARRDLAMPHLSWVIWDPRQKGDGTTLDQGDRLATDAPWRADAVEGLIEVQGVESSGVTLWQEGSYDRANLVPLKRSHPGRDAVKVRANLIDASPDGLTACKARICNGSLDVSYVDERWKWKFIHDHGGPPVVLAQEVCHHFELGHSKGLELWLGSARLLLESQDGEDLVVFLGNTPEEDIFPCGTANPGAKDGHVKLFNRLAVRPHRDPSALIAVPNPGGEPNSRHTHRFEHDPAAKVERVHGANCPPGTWEESS